MKLLVQHVVFPRAASAAQRQALQAVKQRGLALLVLLVLTVYASIHVKLEATSVRLEPRQPALEVKHMPGQAPEHGPVDTSAPLPPVWRTHHIFSSSLTDKCPQQLLPGSWMSHAAMHHHEGMLPFTAKAQEIIWQHQHPHDCSKARFLLFKATASGIGSVLHMETVALQAALDSGRVLLEYPGHFLTIGSYCGGNTTLDSCYFEPLSHCRLSHAEISSAAFLRSIHSLKDPAGPRVAVLDLRIASEVRSKAPVVFNQPLATTAIAAKNRYYWWRAQGVAYIVRPNQRTLAELQRRQRRKFKGSPLAPGCISLYVRHGDKSTEAPVFSDAQYEQVVQRLVNTDVRLTRQLFLSTEDPETVKYFTAGGSGSGSGSRSINVFNPNGVPAVSTSGRAVTGAAAAAAVADGDWQTSYVDMPRKPDTGKSNLDYMALHGFAEEMLDGLLNLDLALQCDGFVASIFSNWARLIDELRSTVRCKASSLYMDAQYTRPQEMDFNW